MPRHRNISVKKELADTVEVFIARFKQLGYGSITQFFEDAARRRLEELKGFGPDQPVMEIISGDAHRALILDRELKTVVEVTFDLDGAFCKYDKSKDCRHVDFLTNTFKTVMNHMPYVNNENRRNHNKKV